MNMVLGSVDKTSAHSAGGHGFESSRGRINSPMIGMLRFTRAWLCLGKSQPAGSRPGSVSPKILKF